MVCRIGVLASGRGSNLQALIDALKNGEDSYQIEVVISDKEEAQALIRPRKSRSPISSLTHENFPIRKNLNRQFWRL